MFIAIWENLIKYLHYVVFLFKSGCWIYNTISSYLSVKWKISHTFPFVCGYSIHRPTFWYAPLDCHFRRKKTSNTFFTEDTYRGFILSLPLAAYQQPWRSTFWTGIWSRRPEVIPKYWSCSLTCLLSQPLEFYYSLTPLFPSSPLTHSLVPTWARLDISRQITGSVVVGPEGHLTALKRGWVKCWWQGENIPPPPLTE